MIRVFLVFSMLMLAGCYRVQELEPCPPCIQEDTAAEADTSTGKLQGCPYGTFDGPVTISTYEDLKKYEGYTGIGGDLHIKNCVDCVDLDPLRCMEVVGGSLRIARNVNLKDLSGLDNVWYISNDLWISSNDALESLEGLAELNLRDGLIVLKNPSLPDCTVCGLLNSLGVPPNKIVVRDNLSDSCTPVPEGC